MYSFYLNGRKEEEKNSMGCGCLSNFNKFITIHFGQLGKNLLSIPLYSALCTGRLSCMDCIISPLLCSFFQMSLKMVAVEGEKRAREERDEETPPSLQRLHIWAVVQFFCHRLSPFPGSCNCSIPLDQRVSPLIQGMISDPSYCYSQGVPPSSVGFS